MGRKHRQPLNLKDVINQWKPPYISILNLTKQYQDKGIRLLHYRFALVKSPNITSDISKQMQQFFGRKLTILYTLHEVQPCISSTANLCKYLRALIQWKALERIPDPHVKNLATYQITPSCIKLLNQEMTHVRVMRKIKDCSPEFLKNIETQINTHLQQKFLEQLKQTEYPPNLQTFKQELIDTIISNNYP